MIRRSYNMPKQIKAVAYARVSSKEQAEKELSIPAQLEAIRDYCQQKGYTLVHEYVDAGKSAKTDERPEFQRMIAAAKRQNRDFNAIIVYKFDRFSRNRDDHVIYKSLLKKIGVTVYSVTEQTDPETPHGFLLEGIMEVISEFYSMNLKAESMKGLTENAKRGFHNGGRAPYGYRLSFTEVNGVKKTQYVLGPENEIEAVKRIFHLRAYEHLSAGNIANLLNQAGIPSYYGNKWLPGSIKTILTNEAYIGNLVWNMKDHSNGCKKKPESEWIRFEKAHPAIVSREVFMLVNKR